MYIKKNGGGYVFQGQILERTVPERVTMNADQAAAAVISPILVVSLGTVEITAEPLRSSILYLWSAWEL